MQVVENSRRTIWETVNGKRWTVNGGHSVGFCLEAKRVSLTDTRPQKFTIKIPVHRLPFTVHLLLFLFLFFLLPNPSIQAQVSATNSSVLSLPDAPLPLFSNTTASWLWFPSAFANAANDLQTNYQSPVIYNYNNIGVFCKLDVQLEKIIKLPVKFRLGTVQYVNKLEGKPW